MSTNEERLQQLARDSQKKQDQLNQQLAEHLAIAPSRRAANGHALARKHVDAWIRIIERSIGDHPNGTSYSWSVRIGWWSRKAQLDPNQATTPGIDPSTLFPIRDEWGVDVNAYVNSVNEQLGGVFEIDASSDVFGTYGTLSWRRK